MGDDGGLENWEKVPSWYWKHGLHDAKVLSICEESCEPDWKSSLPVYNTLEIQLDSTKALYETDIIKIKLMNYKWISEPINVADYPELWWERDTLACLPSGKFSLEIILQAPKKRRVVLQMEFTAAEVEKTV